MTTKQAEETRDTAYSVRLIRLVAVASTGTTLILDLHHSLRKHPHRPSGAVVYLTTRLRECFRWCWGILFRLWRPCLNCCGVDDLGDAVGQLGQLGRWCQWSGPRPNIEGALRSRRFTSSTNNRELALQHSKLDASREHASVRLAHYQPQEEKNNVRFESSSLVGHH